MNRKCYLISVALVIALCVIALVWFKRKSTNAPGPTATSMAAISPSAPAEALASTNGNSPPASTTVYVHNLLLRKGPTFRIYIRWIRGEMLRTHRNLTPSFDDPNSFVFYIQKGIIHANLGDIGNFLNLDAPANFPLKNITVVGEGDQVRLTGTLHKLFVPLPVEIRTTVSATPDGRIHLHLTKINVLKLPLKGLLGGLHVEIDDIMGHSPIRGLEVSGNDLFFDTTELLPPPHIRGQLTNVRLARPDLVLTYGKAPTDETELAQWHNFLRLNGGDLDFGKLTMHHTDLTLIDASNDAWFDLDLVNYQAQLVNGYSRMTAQAGLEIFMPDLDDKAPKQASRSVTLEWLKNRTSSLPSDVPAH